MFYVPTMSPTVTLRKIGLGDISVADKLKTRVLCVQAQLQRLKLENYCLTCLTALFY